MIRYLPELIRAISEPSTLACDLFARRIISRAVYNEAIDSKSGSKQDKRVSICDAVLRSVHVTPGYLVEFVEAARKDSPAVDDLCEEIIKDPAYGKVVNITVAVRTFVVQVLGTLRYQHEMIPCPGI